MARFYLLAILVVISHARPNGVDRLNSGSKELGSQESFKKDLIIQGSLDQNWIQMIVPYPSVVNLLGRLSLLASGAEDFELTRPESGSYLLLKHPDSFKASLHQVTDWAWKAFMAGHSSMDIIAQRTSLIPRTIYDSVDLLLTEDHAVIEAFMPKYLDEATKNVQECTISATETQEKFADMAEIVAEILQGSLSTSQWSQLEQDRLELDVESKRQNKARLEKNKAAIEAQIRETKIEVDEWRGKYENQFDDMPDGWSLLGRRVCDNLLSAAVENIIYLAPKLPGKFQGLLSVGIKMFDEVSNLVTTVKPAVHKQPEVSQFGICVNGHDGSSTNPVKNQVRIFSIKEKTALTILGGDFVKVINKYKTDIASEENPDDITSDVKVNEYIGTLLDLVEEPFKVKGVQDDIKTPVLNLIGRIRDTASEISALQKSGHSEGQGAKYQNIIENYLRSAECLKAMAAELLDLPIVDPEVPFDENNGNDVDVVDDLTQAEQKLTMAETRLDSLEAIYEEKLEKQANLADSLAKVLSDLQRVSATETTIDSILAILKEALVLFSELQNEWKKITSFFQVVENRINQLGGKTDTMVDRLQTITDKESQSLSKYTGNALYKGLLSALAEVQLANQAARKYVIISGEHTMPSVTKLSQLITANDENRERFQMELEQDYAKANDAIKSLIRKEKTGFVQQIEERKKEVRDTYEPLLTGLDPVMRKEIKDNINAGLKVAVDVSKANKMAIQDEGTLMKATTKTLASRKFGSSVVGSGDDDLLWG